MSMAANIAHWLVVGAESLAGHVSSGAMLNLITAAAIVMAASLVKAATQRTTPRFFDLALLATIMLLMMAMLYVYSNVSRVVVT